MRLAAAGADAAGPETSVASTSGFNFRRRQALAALVTVPAFLQANAALAVQGLTAGRIPGALVQQTVINRRIRGRDGETTCSQLVELQQNSCWQFVWL